MVCVRRVVRGLAVLVWCARGLPRSTGHRFLADLSLAIRVSSGGEGGCRLRDGLTERRKLPHATGDRRCGARVVGVRRGHAGSHH